MRQKKQSLRAKNLFNRKRSLEYIEVEAAESRMKFQYDAYAKTHTIY